jgi:hypothetical protein
MKVNIQHECLEPSQQRSEKNITCKIIMEQSSPNTPATCLILLTPVVTEVLKA